MRIVIACDGSVISESAVAAIAALGPDACRDVHLLTVINPSDLHGVTRAHGASPFFVALTMGQGEVIHTPGGGHAVPETIGLMGREVHSEGPSGPDMAEIRSQALERIEAEHLDYLCQLAGHYLPENEVESEIAFSDNAAEESRSTPRKSKPTSSRSVPTAAAASTAPSWVASPNISCGMHRCPSLLSARPRANPAVSRHRQRPPARQPDLRRLLSAVHRPCDRVTGFA